MVFAVTRFVSTFGDANEGIKKKRKNSDKEKMNSADNRTNVLWAKGYWRLLPHNNITPFSPPFFPYIFTCLGSGGRLVASHLGSPWVLFEATVSYVLLIHNLILLPLFLLLFFLLLSFSSSSSFFSSCFSLFSFLFFSSSCSFSSSSSSSPHPFFLLLLEIEEVYRRIQGSYYISRILINLLQATRTSM